MQGLEPGLQVAGRELLVGVQRSDPVWWSFGGDGPTRSSFHGIPDISRGLAGFLGRRYRWATLVSRVH